MRSPRTNRAPLGGARPVGARAVNPTKVVAGGPATVIGGGVPSPPEPTTTTPTTTTYWGHPLLWWHWYHARPTYPQLYYFPGRGYFYLVRTPAGLAYVRAYWS